MKTENIYSPLIGEVIKLSDMPDKVFSSGILGEGVAIVPKKGKLFSPVNGEISMLFPTKHAIGIKTECGNEILIHFGLETVKLNGEGFTLNVLLNQKIKKGDLLLTANLRKIQKKVPSTTTPIVITNCSEVDVKVLKDNGKVTNDSIIMTILSE